MVLIKSNALTIIQLIYMCTILISNVHPQDDPTTFVLQCPTLILIYSIAKCNY